MDFLQQWIIPPNVTVSPAWYLVTAFAALFINAVSKGGFGGGVGIISVPLMLQVVPDVRFVVGLMLPVLVVCDVVTIRSYPKQWSGQVLIKLFPGMLLGVVLATMVLSLTHFEQGTRPARLGEAWLKFAIAIISLVFVCNQLRPRRASSNAPWKPGWGVSLPIGILGGVSTTIAHAAGPVVNMFLIPQRLEKEVFVGTCGRFFGIFNTLKVPFMIGIGVISAATFKYGLWMMLLCPLGVRFGKWINTRLSPTWFLRLIYIGLLFVSGKLIIDWMLVLTAAEKG